MRNEIVKWQSNGGRHELPYIHNILPGYSSKGGRGGKGANPGYKYSEVGETSCSQ